jgi:hypothetical protein
VKTRSLDYGNFYLTTRRPEQKFLFSLFRMTKREMYSDDEGLRRAIEESDEWEAKGPVRV